MIRPQAYYGWTHTGKLCEVTKLHEAIIMINVSFVPPILLQQEVDGDVNPAQPVHAYTVLRKWSNQANKRKH